MKKIDSILQKAALFEKLAVYGDRSSFLRAFAASPLSPDMKGRLERVMKDIAGRKPALADKMYRFYDGTNTNLRELLPLVNEAAGLIPRETNAPQRDNAEQLAEMLGGTPRTSNIASEPEDPNAPVSLLMEEDNPKDVITGRRPQMTQIPADVRQKLKELGYSNPINTAAEGQKALDWFRHDYNPEYILPPSTVGKPLYSLIMKQNPARNFVESNKTVTPI